MKKKLKIITIIVAIAILAMYITSIATSYSVGDSVYLGMAYSDATLVDGNGNKLEDSKNLMNSSNFDYFCAKRGVQFGTGGRAISFSNVAKVEIVGNTATVTAGREYGTLDPTPYTETYVEEETNSNKVLALLFYKIKDGEETINEVNVNGVATGNKITVTRTRSGDGGYGFPYDFGQWAMWRNMLDWRNNVGRKIDTQKQSLWNKIASVIQSEEPSDWTTSYLRKQAYQNGKQLYQEVIAEANKMNVDNEYGIEETYYSNIDTDKKIEIRIEENSYTILGPFKYNFVGNIENGKPTLTFNEEATPQEYIIGTYVGSIFTETNEIVSGNEFYIKVPTISLTGVTNIHFDFQIEGISLSKTKTTIYFFERSQNLGSYQPIINIQQEEAYNNPFKDSYKVSKLVDVSLEKKAESGDALKGEGIKFQIKDETNTVVAHFTTDVNGNGIVTNSNGELTEETKVMLLTDQPYTLIETENNIYGYKNSSLTADKVEIDGAQIEQSGDNIKFILKGDCENAVTIKAKNQKELANLEIEKQGEKGTKLENVAFKIQIDKNKYLQLKDNEGKILTSVKGEITINSNNKANENEYHVEYIENQEEATQFITDDNGKIVINNLELNKSKTEKYSYTAFEISNSNYGYGSEVNISLTGSVTELKLNESTQIKLTNQIDLGNLKLEKYDQDKTEVKLENVEFVIEISPAPEKVYAYLALHDKDGNILQNVKGTVTINRQNIANADGKEYKVSYYCTDKAISEMTDEEKANITTFITESDGTLSVNNLEVYSTKTSEKHTYKLVEISNSNYGFIADSVELGNIELESNKTVSQVLGNEQTYTKISGYVWIENSAGKSNEYDGIYTEGSLSTDIKLTDLYITTEGKLVKNPEAVTPVEIKLRNKTTGEFIKTLPDEFDESGKYTFVDVEIGKLANYEVVFVYDGFYYTTVVEQLDNNNGSKAKEVVSEREALSNKFATIKHNNEIVATDGSINTVEYHKDGHTSIVSKLNFDTALLANTTVAEYNLRNAFNELKTNATGLTEELSNVNMGIVLREQPKISINSDIYSVLVDFEGYEYNYKYNGRQNYYENKNGDDIGVKFEQENTEKRYTRTVYASDIQAAKDQGKEIKVAVTYKIQVANESRTLSIMPKQLINYFDSRYSIKAVGKAMDEATHKITDTIGFSEAQNVEGYTQYKSTVIDYNQTIGANSPNVKDIYITFDVERDAILDLLNNKSTYHNATEILSYASYYGEGTSKVNGKQNITDITEAGKIYAGIDKMSQPGNMEIALINHSNGEGTQILDTTNFEDDTTSAPSLLLEATQSRVISGTIWEDSITNTTDNQKLGDGIYSEGEKTIQNVIVELHKLNEDGSIGEIAEYSNGELVIAKTDEKGTYKFGYYDEANKKHVGIMPGRYVIQYTYNNEAYIVGKKNINVNEYKSTIISSTAIENAFKGQNQRWYVTQENSRYSDARDYIYLRPEYNPNIEQNTTVTNSTYKNILDIDSMEAHTSIMDIGIEFTQNDEAEVLTLELIKELTNVDFGIAERPDVDIEIKKQITGLEITTQTGSNIIPKGDPSNPEEKMQYVKTGLDGIVPIEIETKLLQGAKLNLEYTITVVNNSDKDYLEEEYYYYGRIPEGATESTTKVKQVVDYLDSTIALEKELNQAIWKEKTINDLYDTETKEGLITEDVYNELKNGNYHILTTEAFEEVGAGSEKSIKLYATKALAVSDNIREENKVEILELTGKRTIKESIPGNYVPSEKASEQNEDEVALVITPPTGTTVNYILYIVAVAVTLTILVVGIVIIKKRVIK